MIGLRCRFAWLLFRNWLADRILPNQPLHGSSVAGL